ncbi:MAG: uL15 family ribosomal protein [archaeon]
MRVHKRPKNSRIRGARTCGWGFRQKHKGHGNKGGFGGAGTHAHKRQSTEMAVKKGVYFGKQGVTSRGTLRDKRDRINLYDIKQNMFVKDGQKINLAKYKILGSGDGFKAEIVALSASALAIEKMKKAGGKIILAEVKVDVKQHVKVEKEKKEK